MWFFVDESWSPDEYKPCFGVLLGILVKESQLHLLDKFLYEIRKKYFGKENAKDKEKDLKGKLLLANQILAKYKHGQVIPNNVCIVKEILSLPIHHEKFYIKVFASTVFREDEKKPALLSPNAKRLSRPFKELIENVSCAAKEEMPKSKVNLVFDQRLGAQQGIAISIHNFIGGMDLSNISKYPYFAVSNVSPGVQVADIFAYLLSKRAQKRGEIMSLYRDMCKLQWTSSGNPKQYGLRMFNERGTGDDLTHTVRKGW